MRVQKKSCSYVKVIMIMQATVMAVFFIYFHWYHHTTITFGEHRSYVNYTTQDLYMNGKLHFNVSLRNEQCVEEFLKKYRKYCNRAIVPTLDIFRSNSEKAAITLCPCIPHSSKFSVYVLQLLSCRLILYYSELSTEICQFL